MIPDLVFQYVLYILTLHRGEREVNLFVELASIKNIFNVTILIQNTNLNLVHHYFGSSLQTAL